MRKCFPGYLPKTKEDYDIIWDKCTFVFDTNILLNMYRYSQETQNVFFTILDKVQDKVWLPHQVVKEFFKNRIKVIIDQRKMYDNILDLMKFGNIKNELIQYKDRHIAINIDNILNIIQKTEDDIKKELDKSRSKDINYLDTDIVLSKLLNIFDGKVGKSYDNNKLKDLYKIAQERYKYKIPPGFKDDGKSEPDKYNDYIVWAQIIDYAKEKHTNIVLITDDTKEDWWQPKESGKTLGPRLELLDEMYKLAETQCLIYNTRTFLDQAKTKILNDINEGLVDNAIGEVQSLNINRLADASIKELESLGYTVPDLQEIVEAYLQDGAGCFSTMDVVEKLTGKYNVGNSINRIVGVILSELQGHTFFIVSDGRMSCVDDNGRTTTTACWKRAESK